MKKLKLARLIATVLSVFYSSNKIRNKGKANQSHPFFIISAGRSGSTLLNRILNESNSLFLPSEQYFLGPSILKYRIYRFMIWRDLLKVITSELTPPFKSHTWDVNVNAINDKLLPALGRERTLERIIDTIFATYGVQFGKTDFRWGDSTPLNTHYIRDIYFLYPKARYIFLIRDGRDVVNSYVKGGKESFGPLSAIGNASAQWNKSVSAYDFLKRNKASIRLVKYEDLVAEPVQNLRQLCDYLEVDFNENMLLFHKNIPKKDFYLEEHHKKIYQPVNTESIGSFITELNFADTTIVTRLLGKNLNRFGYLK